jgi:copper transport protein
MTRGERPGRTWRPSVVRSLVALAVAASLTLVVAGSAGAHALRVSSSPGAGAVVSTAPSTITVTFGEQPDPKLSTLRVLDSTGHNHAAGPTQVVPGQPLTLEVKVGPLGRGVYTVAWTTVSKVDGHLAGGTFAFGVGVAPTGPASAQAVSSTPSVPVGSTTARWFFYAGLIGLVGGAAIGVSCFASWPGRRATWLLAGAWLVAILASVAIAATQARAAHVAFGQLLGSTFGHQLAVRAVPLLIGALLLVIPPLRRRRRAAVVVGAAGLVAMWGDVTDSHAAAATRDELLKMATQWVHFAAAAIWVGGLVMVLVGLAGLAASERRTVARRFSAIALVSVIVLAASGTLRAIDEVGTWHALTSTSFGQAILVKSALLLVLVGLGAFNRYRSIPAVEQSPRSLLTVGRIEVAVVAVVLVATAILQGLAPPASVAASTGPPPLVVTGHDFATTVKVRLTVAPGLAGFNQFDLRAVDYDTGRPVSAAASLSFSKPDQPDLGSSTLRLRRAADGDYLGSGPNLSIAGRWQVAVLLQQSGNGTEVDLSLTTRTAPEHITVIHSPGSPDLYTIALEAGRSLQTYLDPGRPGLNEFHATYLGPNDQELAMRSLSVTASGPGHPTPTRLTVRKLDQVGHYVADLEGARPGSYHFTMSAVAADGTTYQSDVTIPVRR